MFGRNRRTAAEQTTEPTDAAVELVEDLDEAEEVGDEEPAAEFGFDEREDGPFDIDEVELGADAVQRIDLGTLIVTPFPGLNLQLQVHEASKQVRAITGVWRGSGLEVVLFAAPASGGLAAEQQEELIEQSKQAGGSAELGAGPFGPEVRRILPQAGPNGQQLFHVSRSWFAEGPRWLLRGTLMGEAALPDGDAKARPFVEFFRNLVVRRGDAPRVPGEVVTMELPRQAQS